MISENVAELNDGALNFLTSNGLQTTGKSEMKTPDGVVVTENFQQSGMEVGFFFWTPKN
jgi:hypothetical protein